MTTLTPVKYITQQELLDVLPRTMYEEKGKSATAGTYHASGLDVLIRGKSAFQVSLIEKKKAGWSFYSYLSAL